MTPAEEESGLEIVSFQVVENGIENGGGSTITSGASPERIVEALLCEQTTHERRENRPQNETDDTEPLT